MWKKTSVLLVFKSDYFGLLKYTEKKYIDGDGRTIFFKGQL